MSVLRPRCAQLRDAGPKHVGVGHNSRLLTRLHVSSGVTNMGSLRFRY